MIAFQYSRFSMFAFWCELALLPPGSVFGRCSVHSLQRVAHDSTQPTPDDIQFGFGFGFLNQPHSKTPLVFFDVVTPKLVVCVTHNRQFRTGAPGGSSLRRPTIFCKSMTYSYLSIRLYGLDCPTTPAPASVCGHNLGCS